MFELTDDLLEFGQEGFDDILNQLGKTCKIIYPARFIECVNCIYDPIGSKSSNRWKTGGPMQFHVGACPMCNGVGKRATENSENITMTVNWTPGKNYTPVTNVRVNIGYIIQTRGFMSDLTKVRQCDEMVIIGEMEPYSHYRFKLDGEPAAPFQAIKGRYFIANWKRAG